MNMPQAITQTLELVLPIADFSTLQLGMGWLTEDFGGLNRVYYESIKYLPTVGVGVQGLVAGTGDRVQQESHGVVQAFAPYEAKLWQRWGSLWRSTKQLLNSQQPDLVVSHFAAVGRSAFGGAFPRALGIGKYGGRTDGIQFPPESDAGIGNLQTRLAIHCLIRCVSPSLASAISGALGPNSYCAAGG
jgi:hypothetical protein